MKLSWSPNLHFDLLLESVQVPGFLLLLLRLPKRLNASSVTNICYKPDLLRLPFASRISFLDLRSPVLLPSSIFFPEYHQKVPTRWSRNAAPSSFIP